MLASRTHSRRTMLGILAMGPQPNVRAVLERQGLIARGGPSERLAALIARDRLRWAKVVKDAGITSE